MTVHVSVQRALCATFLVCCLAVPKLVRAQLMDPISVDYSAMILANQSMYWSGEQLEESSVEEGSARATRTPQGTRKAQTTTRAPATTFASSPAASTVGAMADRYPAVRRAAARETFQRMLSGYEQLADRFGVPKNDLAGAVAAFLAGNYMAYRSVDFPDDHFTPLVKQVRVQIATHPQFAQASQQDKQAAFEQLAIVGMMMAATNLALKHQPDAQLEAKLRSAAKGYLEAFLKTDADSVELTAQGLKITAAAGSEGARSHSAPPSAPAGWRLMPGKGATTYRPADAPDVELQLLPAEADMAGLSAWFDRRIRSASQGLAGVGFGPAQAPGQGILMAVGTAPGAALRQVVAALACENPRGQKQLAFLRLPADTVQLQRHVEPAASVVAAACRGTPAPPPGAAPATPPSTAQAAPPSETARTLPPQHALRESEIAGVLYAWLQVFEVTGLQMREWTYLLLKDGSARRSVPAQAPADFDLAADRQGQTSDWGRWRRKGTLIEVDFGEGFTEPPQQLLRLPGRAGERLNGRFESSASGSVAPGFSHWSNWGVHLKPDGSFTRFSSGGMGGTTGAGDRAVVTQARRDDRGSVTTVGGANVAGSVSRASGVGDDELQGSYRIDGWTMHLQYRSGRQERLFFYTDETRRNLWFEGKELYASPQK